MLRSQCARVVAYLLAGVLTQATSVGTAAAQSIRIEPARPVALGLKERPLIEPHLTIHPGNQSHLLGAVMVSTAAEALDPQTFAKISADRTCATFLSLDAGRTWERHDFPISRCMDPWVAITPDGQAVFSALGSHAALPQQGNGLLVFSSKDGGRTWDDTPVGLGRGHDHPMMAVDAGTSDHRGWLYMISSQDIRADGGKARSTISIARSRNGGKTFDAPVHLLPNNLYIRAESPVVLSGGTLVVSFVDVGRGPEGEDGLLARRHGWVMRSEDGGYTFSMPLFASEACGPPGFSLSVLAADTSARSPFRDRMYFACSKHGGGALMVSASADGGGRWTEPIPVHTAPADTTLRRYQPALAVNQDGVLGAAWIESRQEKGVPCSALYFTSSFDGGRTFLPEKRVSAGRSCPDPTLNGATARSWPAGGDYFGLVALPDGTFRLLWSDASRGRFQLSTTAVTVEGRVGNPK